MKTFKQQILFNSRLQLVTVDPQFQHRLDSFIQIQGFSSGSGKSQSAHLGYKMALVSVIII
jgi:hypothetical protein